MPLMSAPEKSCVLLMEPTRRYVARLPNDLRENLEHGYSLLEEAVRILKVPQYVACPESDFEESSWFLRPGDIERKRVFTWSDGTSPWSNSDLTGSLYHENRSSLFIGGFWLDESITFAALSALADGYDTYLLVDISIARTRETRKPATERLIQAGVVPTTTKQLVSEWMAETSDASCRAKLQQVILKSLS